MSQLPSKSTTFWSILEGDCRESMRSLEPGSAQTCVTSPPYFGLRDYGHNGQIGLEPTPDEFVSALVEVFRGVRRVLRDDGTVWLNLGDSYAAGGGFEDVRRRAKPRTDGRKDPQMMPAQGRAPTPLGCKPKDLIGVPWMVAFALRADGWYLRSDVIWSKPNPMPESVTDRPTKAHEYLFLLSKSPRYFYDAASIREDQSDLTVAMYGGQAGGRSNGRRGKYSVESGRSDAGALDQMVTADGKRNRRSVWTVATQPFPGAHFATFPPKLIEPCILAGSRENDTVLDPFSGSGTTGMVALRHGRSYIGCELNPEYVRLSRDRIITDAPLLNTHAEAA